MLRHGRLVCGRLLFAGANIRVCCAIVPENEFSPHRPSIPTIFDCNNLPSVCSRLLPPFEIYDCKFDNLPRCRTEQATHSGRLFRLIKGLGRLVAVWQCCLRLANVQRCYATLEHRLRSGCSNKFGNSSQPLFQTCGLSAHPPCLHYSNLRQPFEFGCYEFDNLPRYRTEQTSRLLPLDKIQYPPHKFS